MIIFEGVLEGAHWKLMRNSRLICYCNKRADAERMLLGYHEVTVASGKEASLQIFEPSRRRIRTSKPKPALIY